MEVFATIAAVARISIVKYADTKKHMVMEVNANTVDAKNLLMAKEVKMGRNNLNT